MPLSAIVRSEDKDGQQGSGGESAWNDAHDASGASNPDTNTDVITEYINKADLKKVYVQPKKEERLGHNIRLTIDYPEDLEFYRTLYKEVNYMASGPEIVNVCLANSFQKINWHKHGEFLDNQKMFNQKVRSKIIKDMGNYE